MKHERAFLILFFFKENKTDAEARRSVVHLVHPQSSVLVEWWNTPMRRDAIGTTFAYHFMATLYVFRIYAKVYSLLSDSLKGDAYRLISSGII